MDKISQEKRSWNMSRIRHANTKPELLIRRYLYSQGYRYKIKNSLYGKPDIIFKNKKIAVFVNGCFWHKHKNCKLSYAPKTNTVFWTNKLSGNVKRDTKVDETLNNQGWTVIRVWECDIETDFNKAVKKILKRLQS